jgi:predicted Fe-Mo cluster-binding NifX family protein
MKVAIPMTSEGPDAIIGAHFGHAEKFALFEIDDSTKKVLKFDAIQNLPHQQGGCLQPVMLLKNLGAHAIIVLGMGQRPFLGFQEVGIQVIRGIQATVNENIQAFIDGKLSAAANSTCNH